MDKDLILRVVGELYLQNAALNETVIRLNEEISQLRKLVESLQGDG